MHIHSFIQYIACVPFLSLSPSLLLPFNLFLLRSDLFLVPKGVHMLVGGNVDVYFLVETTCVRYRAIQLLILHQAMRYVNE